MATKLDGLKLDDAHATLILEKAIEFEAYTDEMPETKKARIAAASEQIALLLDSWNNGVNPDNEDEDIAAMGELIAEILAIAGVTVDEDGDVEFGELPELDDDDADDDNSDDDNSDDDNSDDDDDGDGDDEAAVGIDDIIDGYDDLSAAGKVKAIKALELDTDDEDDVNVLVALHGYESEQEKPSSRVLQYIEGLDGLEEALAAGGEDADDDNSDDDDADEPEAEEESGEDGEEPWDGYDKASAADIRKVLDAEFKEGNLTAEQVQYVKDYEEAREKPPTRKNVVKKCDELLAKLEEQDGDDEPEEAPAPKKASLAGAKKGGTTKAAAPEGGTITLTREQILEALTEGSVEITL